MDLATYFWQVNVAWLLLYAVYWAFLCRDTFFRWNRFYLLAATVFAISFPFLPIPTLFQDAVPEDQVLLFFGGEQQEVAVTQAVKVEVQTLFTWENILLSTYLIGALFLFMRLIINLLKIFKLAFPISSAIRRNTKIMSVKENYFIVQTPVGTPIFSFLNILFWNENAGISGEEKAKIIAHELVHIRQWHSLDVLFMELMTIVFWCNPIAWAYRKSLQAVHEYLADAKVLEKETSKTDYANLLVSQFLHTNTLYLSNHFFNKSLLKNRIMMMYQKKSNQKAFVKFAFVLPIVAICLLVAACSKELNNIQAGQFDIPKGFEVQQKYTLNANKEILIDMDSSTSYMVRMSNPRNNYQGIILALYNSKNEEVVVNKVDNRYFNGWTYVCKNMGKYKIVMKMDKDSDDQTVMVWAKRKVEMRASTREVTTQSVTQISQTFELNHKEYNSCMIVASVDGQEDSYKDYYINVFKPNGERIGVKGYEGKGHGTIFRVDESGTYRVEVIPTKGKLPENTQLHITKRYFEEKDKQTTPTAKPAPYPFSVKEYEAPMGKESVYEMILAKNITYSFRVISGSAEIKVIDREDKVGYASENGELIVKNIEKVGIYKLRISPKGNTDAKITLALIVE